MKKPKAYIEVALEIERKFLIKNDTWKAAVTEQRPMRQGYLSRSERSSIRVRVSGQEAWLSVKTASERLTVRREYEYPIPLHDALELLESACVGPLVEKTRFLIEHRCRTWEIDVFEGANAGLVVAEIELEAEDAALALPDWAGEEVSHDPKYLNQNLADFPFSHW